MLDIRLNWLRWPISLAVRKKLNISMRTLLKRNMLYFVQGRNVNFLSIHWYFRYETTFNFAAIAAIFTFKFWFCTPDYDVFPLKICVWQKLARLTFNIDYVTPQRLFDTLDGMFSPNPWIYFTFPSGSENIWKGGRGGAPLQRGLSTIYFAHWIQSRPIQFCGHFWGELSQWHPNKCLQLALTLSTLPLCPSFIKELFT